MIRKRIINIGLMLLFFVALFTQMPTKTFAAETVAKHKIFSEKTIQKRIAEIKDYYYNQPKTLTKKSIEYRDKYSDEAVIRFDYYLHGKDLMFAYGVETKQKTEYRLYFYKDQIIKVLIDKKGKKRQTHD